MRSEMPGNVTSRRLVRDGCAANVRDRPHRKWIAGAARPMPRQRNPARWGWPRHGLLSEFQRAHPDRIGRRHGTGRHPLVRRRRTATAAARTPATLRTHLDPSNVPTFWKLALSALVRGRRYDRQSDHGTGRHPDHHLGEQEPGVVSPSTGEAEQPDHRGDSRDCPRRLHRQGRVRPRVGEPNEPPAAQYQHTRAAATAIPAATSAIPDRCLSGHDDIWAVRAETTSPVRSASSQPDRRPGTAGRFPPTRETGQATSAPCDAAAMPSRPTPRSRPSGAVLPRPSSVCRSEDNRKGRTL
jgi:hypothetical protein